MKKIFAAVTAACTAAFLLAACDGGNGRTDYGKLNSMLGAEYSAVTLTVTDTFGDGTVLTSEYIMTFSEEEINVQYTVEQLAGFGGLDGTLPHSPKKTLSGSAVIAGGEVMQTQGDDVGLSADIAGTGFTFKEEYFENVSMTAASFSANVKDPSAFLGKELTCTGMTVQASFGSAFSELTVRYGGMNGGSVQYLYKFTV